MLSTKKALGFVLAMAIVGCGDSSATRPTPATVVAPSLDKSSDANGRGVEQLVTGAASINVPLFDNANQSYVVAAKERGDGAFFGLMDLVQSLGSTRNVMKAETYCFTIVGNTGRMAARVTQSTTPDVVPGSYLIWTVMDNHPANDGDNKAKAGKSAPDMSTAVFRVNTAAEADWHCLVGIDLAPFFPVKGAINVNDKSE